MKFWSTVFSNMSVRKVLGTALAVAAGEVVRWLLESGPSIGRTTRALKTHRPKK